MRQESTLSKHVLEAHGHLKTVNIKIGIFHQYANPLEIQLREAHEIEQRKPSNNRNHERTWYLCDPSHYVRNTLAPEVA